MRTAVGLLCLSGDVVATLSMLYFFFGMLGNIKPGKKRVSQFLGPFVLIAPGLLTEAGGRYRLRLICSIVAFVLCFLGASLVIQKG
jgi:hypothetical protein